jgi:hypothetical protein
MNVTATTERQTFDAKALALRWGVSSFTARRLMKSGALKSINIGSRRMVPLSEVLRAEQFGAGQPRTRRNDKGQQ